eukprot:jgi/Mesvir1/20311/Mv19904-RA.3
MGCFCCKSPQGKEGSGLDSSPARRKHKNRSGRHSRLEGQWANLEALSSAYTGIDHNAGGEDYSNSRDYSNSQDYSSPRDVPSLHHHHVSILAEDNSPHERRHGIGRSSGAYVKLAAATGGSGSAGSSSGSKVHGHGVSGGVGIDDSVGSDGKPTAGKSARRLSWSAQGSGGNGGGVARAPPGTQLMRMVSPPPLPIGRGIVTVAQTGHSGAQNGGHLVMGHNHLAMGPLARDRDDSGHVTPSSSDAREAGFASQGTEVELATVPGSRNMSGDGGGHVGRDGVRAAGWRGNAGEYAGGGGATGGDGVLGSPESEPVSPSLGKLPSERTRRQVQDLEDTMMELSPQERDALLRDELLLLSPLIRQVFPVLPSTTCSFVLQADDEVDTGAANYLWRLLQKMREHQKMEVVPLRTTGDGSCLLNAISRGIWGVELFSEALRHQLCDELSTHREWYCSHVSPHDVEEAAQQAACPGAFLSNLHVVAMAHVLRRPVVLFDAETSMSNYGMGLYGTAGVFAPLRLPQKTWWPWPVFISWSSEQHNHFVPLVWSAGTRPLTRWLWPEDFLAMACQELQDPALCRNPSLSAVKDPFVLPPAARAALFKRASRVAIQEPRLVLQLVEEVRRQVVALEGALLARVLALAAAGQAHAAAAQGPSPSPPGISDARASATSTDGSLSLSLSTSISAPQSPTGPAAAARLSGSDGLGLGGVGGGGSGRARQDSTKRSQGAHGPEERDGLRGSGLYAGGGAYGSGTYEGGLGEVAGDGAGQGRDAVGSMAGGGAMGNRSRTSSLEDDGGGDHARLMSSWRSVTSMLRMSVSSLSGDSPVTGDRGDHERGGSGSLQGKNNHYGGASGRTLRSAASDLSVDCDNVELLDSILANRDAELDMEALLPVPAVTPTLSQRWQGGAVGSAGASSRGHVLSITPHDSGHFPGLPPLLPSTTPRIPGEGARGRARERMRSPTAGIQSATPASVSLPVSVDVSGHATGSSGSIRAKLGERWDHSGSGLEDGDMLDTLGSTASRIDPGIRHHGDASSLVLDQSAALDGSGAADWLGPVGSVSSALWNPSGASPPAAHVGGDNYHNLVRGPLPAHAPEGLGARGRSSGEGAPREAMGGTAAVPTERSQPLVTDLSLDLTETPAPARGEANDVSAGARIAQPAALPPNAGAREWAQATEQLRQQRHGMAVADVALTRLGNALPTQYREVAGSNGRRISRLAHAAIRIASEWQVLQAAPLAGVTARPLHVRMPP